MHSCFYAIVKQITLRHFDEFRGVKVRRARKGSVEMFALTQSVVTRLTEDLEEGIGAPSS